MAHTSSVPACYLECVVLHMCLSARVCLSMCVCVCVRVSVIEVEMERGRAMLALCKCCVTVQP